MPDDDEILDECIVYRVVKKADVKHNSRAQSGCFSDKAAEDGSSDYMSVYFADQMNAAGLSAADLQARWGVEKYTVVQLTAKEMRAQGERLWRDKNDEFVGHGASKRADGTKRTVSQKRGLANAADIVEGLE